MPDPYADGAVSSLAAPASPTPACPGATMTRRATVADDNGMVAWLEAALDKLAFEAEEAADAGGFEWDSFAAEPGYGAYVCVHGKSLTQGKIVEASGPLAIEHIALHDPRAVLARVEAERAVIATHVARGVQGGPPYRWTCSTCDHAPVDWEAFSDYPCRTLRLLAYGHRFDAPDYRPEWSPE